MSEQQRRNPRDLQGLLRFAMEATRAEDAPEPSNFREMSPERRQFLEEAIQSLTIDVVEQLQKAMNILIEGNATEDEQVEALEIVTDFVENVDTANDFFKIGGFCILIPCLSSSHSEVRSGAAELIGALAQNNPFCQQHLLELELLPKLFELLTDSDQPVAVAALHAISCMVRSYQPCLDEFLKSGGIECLLGALESGTEKIILKAAFLMSALCGLDKKTREEFIALGAVEKLAARLEAKTEYSSLQESTLSALYVLLESEKAVDKCRDSKLDLLQKLQQIKKSANNRDEFQEVIGYVDGIFEKCFSVTDSPDR